MDFRYGLVFFRFYENFLIRLQFLFCDRQARLKDDSMVLQLLRLNIVEEVC